jgi:hypothetical protein
MPLLKRFNDAGKAWAMDLIPYKYGTLLLGMSRASEKNSGRG